MKSQNIKILNHLKSGKALTPLDALIEFSSFRLGARIYDLRSKGWPIHKDIIDIGENRRVARYSITAAKEYWPDYSGPVTSYELKHGY
jgi:hypothetical protein